MGVRHILWKRAEAADSQKIKTCFTFAVPPAIQRENNPRSQLKDPIPLEVCQHISDRLKAERFRVGKIWRGKPWGSGIHVQFTNFEIHYMLMADADTLLDKSCTYTAFSW